MPAFISAGPSPSVEWTDVFCATSLGYEVAPYAWPWVDLPWPEEIPVVVTLPHHRVNYPVPTGRAFNVPGRLYLPALAACPGKDEGGGVPAFIVGLYVLAHLARVGVTAEDVLALREVASGAPYPGALEPFLPRSTWDLVGCLRDTRRTVSQRIAAAIALGQDASRETYAKAVVAVCNAVQGA